LKLEDIPHLYPGSENSASIYPSNQGLKHYGAAIRGINWLISASIYPSNQGLKPANGFSAPSASTLRIYLSIKSRIETDKGDFYGNAGYLSASIYPSNQGLKRAG